MTSLKLTGLSFAAGSLFLACVAAVGSANPPAGAGDGKGQVRLGTFDSRSIAVAHFKSPEYDAYLKGLFQELDQAKQDGDEQRVQELEAFGPALQKKMHEQGFSTASVADILKKIEDQLPGIAEQAGVDVIVSKWDLAYQGSGAELVDVTDLLVAAFHPGEEGLKTAREIRKHEPVPMDQLDHEH